MISMYFILGQVWHGKPLSCSPEPVPIPRVGSWKDLCFAGQHFEPKGYGLVFRKEHFTSLCRSSYGQSPVPEKRTGTATTGRLHK